MASSHPVKVDDVAAGLEAFAGDLRDSLRRVPKQIASKYFYDDLGSQLFEAICRLPWYQVTRTELALLQRHGRAMLGALMTPTSLVELGCGSGEKLAAIAAAGGDAIGDIQLVDISPAALDMTEKRIRQLGLEVTHAHQASYEDGLVKVARHRAAQGPLVLLFLGSNIGNFDPPVRQNLLGQMRRALHPGDALLLGTDLVKPAHELELAYDDPLQVTAAFNRNVLRRINDELGGTFDLGSFSHRAVWNATAQRVEMHLVSARPQHVTVAAAGLELDLAAGESIWTESSYKYEPEQVRQFGADAGFASATQWIDQQARFAVTRFMA
ncbi:MAG: L-histidine N(alpha)-methyltransferase [Vicinamibacterales bacterium]